MDTKLRKPALWLVIALVIVLAFSWLAQGFNTSFGKVSVSRIYFDTEKGTLSGLLYLPKGAGAQFSMGLASGMAVLRNGGVVG